MRFRLFTLLMAITAVCLVLGLGLNAEKVPVGMVTDIGLPIGLVMAVLTGVWCKTWLANKLVQAAFFAVGWCTLLFFVEMVLSALRDHSDDRLLHMLILGLLAVPTSFICAVLLRSWVWAWHDRFDKE